MNRIAALFAVLTLSACAGGGATTATLSPAQCDADWLGVGVADGRDGAAASKLQGYVAACGRGGSVLSGAELAAWREGWRSGVADLCAADDDDLDIRAAEARIGLCGDSLAAAAADATPAHGHHGHARYPGHHHHGPRIYPSVGFGIGVGSGGARFGSRIGIGIGFPLLHRHYH